MQPDPNAADPNAADPNAADPDAADPAQAGQSDLACAIIALFNLSPNTPDADLVTTLQDMAQRLKAPPDPAKYLPVAAVRGMLADQRAERARLSAGRAQGKVDAALRLYPWRDAGSGAGPVRLR